MSVGVPGIQWRWNSQSGRHRVWRELAAAGLLICATIVFHARGLRPGHTFLPVDMANGNLPWNVKSGQPLQNGLISDPLYQFYPFLVDAVDAIQHDGQWPLWNPYILAGHPSFADPLAQTFYPVYLGLALVFGAARGMAIGLWLHVVLGALLMYGYLRVITCTVGGAIVGALIYALSGYMVTWFETPFWLSTLAWLPGVLGAFELAIQKRQGRYIALTALALAIAIFGGQYSFVASFAIFFALYALGRMLEDNRRQAAREWWPLKVFALATLIALLLSAIQTLPFAEFLQNSHRAMSEGYFDPLPVQQLITLIVPQFFGSPQFDSTYWGAWNYSEAVTYGGLSGLLLACLAPFYVRRFMVVWVAGLTIFFMYFSVGGPGLSLLSRVPIFKYISLHRTIFILPLLFGLLAAQTISTRQWSLRQTVALAVLLVSIVVAVLVINVGDAHAHWSELQIPLLVSSAVLVATVTAIVIHERVPRAGIPANIILLAVVYVDLHLAGSTYNPAGPIADLMPPTPGVEFLRERADEHRIAIFQIGDVLFGPNVLSIYRLAEPGGYSSVVLNRYQQLVRAGDPKTEVAGAGHWMRQNANIVFLNHPSQRLLDLLQVGYVVTAGRPIESGVRAAFMAPGCERDSGSLGNTQTISGHFDVADVAINRIDFWPRVYRPSQARSALTLRMWQGPDRARQMLDVQLDTQQWVDGKPVTVFFAPERDAPGHRYSWEISVPAAQMDAGVGLCLQANGEPLVAVYGSDWAEAYKHEMRIYERLRPLPRAYVVYGAESIQTDERALARILDTSFDLYNSAISVEPINLPTQPALRATPARIVHHQHTRVVVHATAAQDGLLVLGDQFYEGWHASVDGRSATVMRVNHVMRGISLPAGTHEVTFDFLPSSLLLGSTFSVMGLFACGALVIRDRK